MSQLAEEPPAGAAEAMADETGRAGSEGAGAPSEAVLSMHPEGGEPFGAEGSRRGGAFAREPGEGGEPTQEDVSLGRRFFNVQTLASFAIAFAILFFLVTRVSIDVWGTARAIAGANPWYYLLALASFYLIFPIRALRWRRMLRNAGCTAEEVPGVPRLAQIIYLSFFANCLVPAKLGDVYRAYLLKRWAGVSGSKAGGTIVAERLLDLTTLLFLAGAAGLVSLRGQSQEKLAVLVGPLEMLAGLIALAAVGLAAMRFWSGWVRGILPARVHGPYGRFEEGTLGAFGSYHVLLPYSLLSWLCEALRLFFVTRAIGLSLAGSLPVELAMVTTVAMVASLLTALPLTPAGLGFVESALVASLLLMGVKGEGLAFSAAFLDRTISYASLVIIGLVVYLASARAGLRLGGGAQANRPDRV